MKKLIFLELNEITFPFIEYYIKKGYLPNWAKVIKENGYYETTSEDVYEHIEPWIQWATLHTGKSYQEHKIFRLGDIVDSKFPQIWEELEAKNLKVAAISPINAANNLKSPAFFVPDPWTDTPAAGSSLIKKLAAAVKQAVNDNAQEKVTFDSKLTILNGLISFAQGSSLKTYIKYLMNMKKYKWLKASLLDRLLADIFIKLWKKEQPDFSSLFLNAGAHIQHHYMFNGAAYSGPSKNPEWYIPKDGDPLLDIYMLYDDIIGEVLNLPEKPRIMLATALSQDPYKKVTFYYRLKDHDSFIKELGINYDSILPRMSRDFLIEFSSAEEANKGEQILKNTTDIDGLHLFDVDNREKSLFVTLSYPKEIKKDFVVLLGNQKIQNFYDKVVFVAIKNGHHNGIGYFIDTATIGGSAHEKFPLTEIKDKIVAHFA